LYYQIAAINLSFVRQLLCNTLNENGKSV